MILKKAFFFFLIFQTDDMNVTSNIIDFTIKPYGQYFFRQYTY